MAALSPCLGIALQLSVPDMALRNRGNELNAYAGTVLLNCGSTRYQFSLVAVTGCTYTGKMIRNSSVQCRYETPQMNYISIIFTLTRFFLTHINGIQLAEDNPLRRWQDTIGTPVDGGSVTFKTRFEKITGKFVIHCHVLEHEDEGMMRIVEVVQQ